MALSVAHANAPGPSMGTGGVPSLQRNLVDVGRHLAGDRPARTVMESNMKSA